MHGTFRWKRLPRTPAAQLFHKPQRPGNSCFICLLMKRGPDGAQRAPPFLLEGAAAEACDCGGGFLAFVIEARHVAAPERVDAMAWALLTLHAHIDMHVKRFKASLRKSLVLTHRIGGLPVQVKPSVLQYFDIRWQLLCSWIWWLVAADFDSHVDMCVNSFRTGVQATPQRSRHTVTRWRLCCMKTSQAQGCNFVLRYMHRGMQCAPDECAYPSANGADLRQGMSATFGSLQSHCPACPRRAWCTASCGTAPARCWRCWSAPRSRRKNRGRARLRLDALLSSRRPRAQHDKRTTMPFCYLIFVMCIMCMPVLRGVQY